MNHEDRVLIERELNSGESLLWSGKPRAGVYLKSSDTLMIPFSLLWGGFALFWEYSAYKMGAPFFFLLWGIPFILAGLYIIFGRFFVEASVRKRTWYGVTSERVIIISGFFKRSVRSVNIKALGELSLAEKRNNFGTITLGQMPPFSNWMQSGLPGIGKAHVPQLEMVPKARSVYDTILNIQKGA